MSKQFKKISCCFFVLLILLCAKCAFADGGNNIGNIAATVVKSFLYIGKLMVAISYLAGIGFSIAAIFKFKQHRDNPTQVPVGAPISLLVIGILLVFLPGLIGPAGLTIFGGTDVNNQAGGFNGNGTQVIPGGQNT